LDTLTCPVLPSRRRLRRMKPIQAIMLPSADTAPPPTQPGQGRRFVLSGHFPRCRGLHPQPIASWEWPEVG
jgi:hypothetical protein